MIKESLCSLGGCFFVQDESESPDRFVLFIAKHVTSDNTISSGERNVGRANKLFGPEKFLCKHLNAQYAIEQFGSGLEAKVLLPVDRVFS